MLKSKSLILATLFIFLNLSILALPSGSIQIKDYKLKGNEKVVKTLSSHSYDIENLTLSPEKYTVSKGDSISKFLRKGGLLTTQGSLRLVYDFNPSLKNINQIRVGMDLYMPKVDILKDAPEKELKDCVFSVLYAPQNIKTLKAAISKSLRHQDKTILALKPQAESDNVTKEGLQHIISIYKNLHWLSRSAKPVSMELISQVEKQALLFNILIEDILSDGDNLTRTHQKKLEHIQNDLQKKILRLKNSQRDDLQVSVKIEGIPNKLKSKLKILYINKSLFDEQEDYSRVFKGFSQGAKQLIPTGDYYFWALKKEEDKFGSILKELITEIHPVEIDENHRVINIPLSAE